MYAHLKAFTLDNHPFIVDLNPKQNAAASLNQEAIMTSPTLSTVKQFSNKHPAFPIGGLRHRIFHEETNGLKNSGAIIRNGRRVLINEEKFFSWLESQN